jgi:hypothetical protein
LIQPITLLSPEKYNVLSLSSANCRWWVLKQVSMAVISPVPGSNIATWRVLRSIG